MSDDELKKFKETYCLTCGSQRCTSEDEWLEACPHYVRENKYSPRIYDYPDIIFVNENKLKEDKFKELQEALSELRKNLNFKIDIDTK